MCYYISDLKRLDFGQNCCQNAGNVISETQISKIFQGHDHQTPHQHFGAHIFFSDHPISRFYIHCCKVPLPSAGSILNIIEKFDTWLCRYRYFEFLTFSIISNVDSFDTWFNVGFACSELTNKDKIIFVKAELRNKTCQTVTVL